MQDKYKIVIPSYKRADILLSNDKNPLSYMDSEMLNSTIIFVRYEEFKYYQAVLKKFKGLKMCVLCRVSHIGNTRDDILKYCYSKNYEKILMIDDDITFKKRINNYTLKRVNQTKEMFTKMIYTLFRNCSNNIPLIGIDEDSFNGFNQFQYDYNVGIIQVYCIHLPTLKEANIGFSDYNLQVMEDYYFTLKLLTLGYKNMCFNIYTRHNKTQSPGGCSEYRTIEIDKKSAKILKKIFPNFITVKYKQSGNWDIKRIVVNAKWKKAFNKKLYEERSKK